MPNNTVEHQNFFLLRTPRMPIVEQLSQSINRQETIALLHSWIRNESVMEALYLASPSLHTRVKQYKKRLFTKEKSDSPSYTKQNNKIESAILKYMIRMSSRPTPFGLFSGVSLGAISRESHFVSNDILSDKRKTRLDIFFLSALRNHLLDQDIACSNLIYYPNSSHYFLGDNCRYIESYQSNEKIQYRLSAIEAEDYFRLLMHKARNGLNFIQLRNCLLLNYETLSEIDAVDYLKSLIQENILQARLPLPLTGASPDQSFVDSLRAIKQTTVADKLSTVIHLLDTLDDQKKPYVTEYQKIYNDLKTLPIKVEENKLFQTDIYRSFDTCELEDKTANATIKILSLLNQLSEKGTGIFTNFIKKFNERYEGQFVSLEKVLDDESGISISHETGYEAPLIAGLKLTNNSTSSADKENETPLNKHFIKLMSLPENRHKTTLKVTSKALLKSVKSRNIPDLPVSFAAILSLYQDKDNQSLIKLNGCYGNSAANLIGRFCHLDKKLQQYVIDHLEKEQSISPDIIFAEIVHMPEGRPGNVIARPHLRQYEIVFLADSSLNSEYQIPINDLYIWVEDYKVKLWSKRLRKQIMPRLSSAHNYSARSLSAYKFLCMIPHQYSSAPNFSPPSAVTEHSFVPRLMIDNVILSEKTWRIPRSEISSLLKKNQLELDKWSQLKKKYALDDNVIFSVSDNVLQLNLTNPMMIEVLLAESKGYSTIELKEALNAQYTTPVKSKDQKSFANELILPVLNHVKSPYQQYAANPNVSISNANIKRRFSPGSSWLSIKVYAGNNAVDALLDETLLPFIEQQHNLYEKWFFIRYGDPDWHLRLRFHGEPSLLYGKLLPKLNSLVEDKIECNEIQKLEVFTYDREVERYGGADIMAQVESLFMADSIFVSKIITLQRSGDPTLTYRATLLFTDLLLSAFNYSKDDKLTIVSQFRKAYGDEFNESSELRKQLGTKYKEISTQLQQDFTQIQTNYKDINEHLTTLDEDTRMLLSNLNEYALSTTPVIKDINHQMMSSANITSSKNSLIGSILHMHNNRMFNAYGREHEFVIYDILRRYYYSQSKINKP